MVAAGNHGNAGQKKTIEPTDHGGGRVKRQTWRGNPDAPPAI